MASPFPDGAAAVARRFGVTVKALRVYEEAGLIRPVRNGHGWRTYGQAECERLHLVLLLRRFGLTIARIAEMFAAGQPDLAAMLDLQAEALTEQQARIRETLSLIGRARRHLSAHGSIDRETLAAFARAEPARLRWTPALQALAARCFTPDQQRLLARVAPSIETKWNAVYQELALILDGPPDTPRARLLGAKAATLINRMTGGDPAMRTALAHFWQDGFAVPEIARSLPMDEKGWQFLGQAMAAHARAESAR
ncbi:MAG: MerR family transcriptional regulator [Gluconacetobacter sp.]